jgi:Flp pilus assembly protein TadD
MNESNPTTVRRRAHPVGIVALAAALAAVLGGAARPVQDLDEARRLFEAGDFAGCASVLEEVLAEDPGDAHAVRLLGLAYYELGDREQARTALGRALALGNLSPDVLSRIARIDQEAGRFPTLANDLRLLAVLRPEDRDWQLLLADALDRAGDPTEALAIYRRLVDERPGDGGVWLRLGNLQARLDRPGDAARCLARAYHLGEERGEVAANAAELWVRAGKTGNAIAWFEKALAPEHDARWASRLAELYLGQGQRREAGELASSLAAAAAPADAARAHVILGRIALEEGDPEALAAHWAAASEAGALSAEEERYLARSLQDRGRPSAAVPHFRRALAADPPDRELRSSLILALVESGELEDAREELRGYLEEHGSDAVFPELLESYRRARADSGS